jgi:hypothetical protein
MLTGHFINVYSKNECPDLEIDKVKQVTNILASIGNVALLYQPGGDLNNVISKIEDRLHQLKEIEPDV